MNLSEYRNLHNNDKVFEIADKIHALKDEVFIYATEHNMTPPKNVAKRMSDMFYWIFMHNICFQFSNYGSINTWKDYIEVSSLNYKRIARDYKFYLKYLVDKKYIILPLLNKKQTGAVCFGLPQQIIKSVKISREMVGEYTKEQLELFTKYLIQDDDPEGVLKICNRVGFIDSNTSRQAFAAQKNRVSSKSILQNKQFGNTSVKVPVLEINNKLNSQTYLTSSEELSKLNNSYTRLFSKLVSKQ